MHHTTIHGFGDNDKATVSTTPAVPGIVYLEAQDSDRRCAMPGFTPAAAIDLARALLAAADFAAKEQEHE